MHQNTVLITGGTGNVGAFLSWYFLRKMYKVVLLVRPYANQTVEDRISNILLKHFFTDVEYKIYSKNLVIIESYLMKPLCGLSSQNLDYLAKLSLSGELKQIYHCAASVDFMDIMDDVNKHQNLKILENVIELYNAIKSVEKIPFNHISSSFVVGYKKGTIYEEKIKEEERSHITGYDKSKFDCELLLYKHHHESSIPYRIFRLSAINGAFKNGKIIKLNSFYLPLRYMKMLKDNIMNDIVETFKQKGNSQIEGLAGKKYGCYLDNDGFLNFNFRFNYFTQSALNLVPIDFITESIYHISQKPESLNKIFHLVSRNRMNVVDFFGVFFKKEKIKGVKFIDPDETKIENYNKLEKKFKKYYEDSGFSTYLEKSCPNYDMSNTAQFIKDSQIKIPEINFSYLTRCYNYANDVMRWKN